MPDPDFNVEKAEKVSKALKPLFNWVKAMYDFNKVFLQTAPLRKKLDEVTKFLNEKTKELMLKKASLAAINKKIDDLESLYSSKIAFKEKLETDIKECEIKVSLFLIKHI